MSAQLETAIWSIADGRSSDDDVARLHADERASLALLDRLIGDAEDKLASARSLPEHERDLVVPDLTEERDSLRATRARIRPEIETFEFHSEPFVTPPPEELEPGEIELHASWASGLLVVWASGRGRTPETHDDLSTRLEAIGGPPLGWQVHPGVDLPGGVQADALAIPVKDALGWLVAIGGGHGRDGVGASVIWLGHVALEGVRLAASGSVVPTLRVPRQPQGRTVNAELRWRPALMDSPAIAELIAAMPGTVAAVDSGSSQATTTAVMSAVVEAIVTESVERMELPAAPPNVTSPTDFRDALIAHLDGTPFRTPGTLAADVSRMLDNWTRTVTSGARPRLVVQLEAPGGASAVWLVSVEAPAGKGRSTPIDAALRAERGARPLGVEWTRLGRLFPAVHRSEPQRRGRVALSQDEAWAFMTNVGPALAAVGFDVRVPMLSRRKATPSLRLFAESSTESVVGARQLTNVAWTVLFDDVELTAAEIALLARQARPLVQSPKGWVEVDRVDLEQAAAALAERENVTQLTGAEILRHSMGLDGSGLRGGIDVRGNSWATDIVRRAESASTELVFQPEGFTGELRTYQAEALAWIDFLDAAELGGCLALDMGLGKAVGVDEPMLTPTGWRRADRIAVGDLVIGVDGRPHPVLGVFPQGEQRRATVSFTDGTSSTVSWDHLWTVQHVRDDHAKRYPGRFEPGLPEGRWRVMSTREILDAGVADRFGNRTWRIPLVAPVEHDYVDLPVDPYVLGQLLGDGCLAEGCVTLSTGDIETIEAIQTPLPDGVSVKHKAGYDYRLTSGQRGGAPNPRKDALRAFGLDGKLSDDKFIPSIYLTAHVEARRALLAGLLDSDGHVRPSDGHVEMTLTSKALIDGAAALVRSLGGAARVHARKGPHGKRTWRLSVALDENPFRLVHKAQAWKPRTKYAPTRVITSIVEATPANCVCFKVDAPSELFVIGNYVVTHNTPTVLAQLARTTGTGPALIVAPAAVVGNWAAEAARFTPGLRVVVHHGASRSSTDEFSSEIAEADMVITTYATAVRDIGAVADVQWGRIVLDEAQAIKNPASDTAQQLRRIQARSKLALTGTPIENGLGDLWAILDFTNPGLVGTRPAFIAQMSGDGEAALRALNGIVLFRRTKSEPEVAAELPDKIDELDHCTMTAAQIGLYQAVLDTLVSDMADSASTGEKKQGAILAAITALKQICNHPAAYRDDGQPLAGRSGKLDRLEEIVESVFAAGERILVFTHFASWGRRLADHLTAVTGKTIACYDGSLARGARDRLVTEFQQGTGPGALVLSLKAGGTGLNLTAANHVVLYDRWWNPAVEDQARDRAWRIGQQRTVISHRLVCPGTVDERVEEVVAGKRHIANLVLPRSSSIADLDTDQLRLALGLRSDELLTEDNQ